MAEGSSVGNEERGRKDCPYGTVLDKTPAKDGRLGRSHPCY